MEPIFKYIDYRRFLADYYNEKKKTTRHFSYRYFAQKAGFKSPNFLKQVIEGDRNLTRRMVERFLTALKLSKKESVFFRNLVLFNQAKTASEKQEHYSVLVSMMDYISEHKLRGDQYDYFNKWYTSVIRELVCLYNFRDDYRLLANLVKPKIKLTEAREALQLLLRLKLIKKQADGTYKQVDSAITSGTDMISLARRDFNRTMINLAAESLDQFAVDERNVSCITMGISKPCYEVLLAELAAFKERVVSIVNKDAKSSRVYQFNFQLFPLSDDTRNIGQQEKGMET
jgi:uncharacterized protein (TIGR02147 family)